MDRLRFRDQYRIEPARLPDWDYAAAGWYFVTICTKDRTCFFGEIRGGVMDLSDIGCAAHWCWTAIPNHFDRARLDAFIVMPNHVHGIIELLPREDAAGPVETFHETSLQRSQSPKTMSDISDGPGSLGVIMRLYKGAVTRWARQNGHAEFAWQPRFYDHVIRTANALDRIRYYIRTNPADWPRDRNHPDRL